MTETRIKRIIDPDFGRIDMIETRFRASTGGGPMRTTTYRSWRGRTKTASGERFSLELVSERDPPEIDNGRRREYRKILSDIDGMKQKVARKSLKLARSWVEQGELDLDLDAASLAALLSLDAVSIAEGGDRIFLYFLESEDIFAGHYLQARLDAAGRIVEVCLSG